LSFSSGTGLGSAAGGGGGAAPPGVHSDAPALKLKDAALGFIVLGARPSCLGAESAAPSAAKLQ
jgi:hypothetical protein